MSPAAGLDLVYLEQAATLEAQVHYRLTTKGYPAVVVDGAIARARGQAQFHTRRLSAEIRGRAFLEDLRGELEGVEAWIAGYTERMAR